MLSISGGCHHFRINSLASLPPLKFLNIKNEITDEAISYLSRCVTLKHLGVIWRDRMNDVFRAIGMNLSSLELRGVRGETWLGLAENCHNLEYLDLHGVGLDDQELVGSLNHGLKTRMKRLASFKVNLVPLRLGTDWKGY
jgi:hypothetical protein